MKLELGFGTGTQTVEISDANLMEVLMPNHMEFTSTGEAEVLRALQNPIGSKRLREIVRPHEKIAIITSDITRPMPTAKVMPALMEELDAAGVSDSDVTVVFGLGSHRHQTESEMRHLVGDVAFERYRCVDSDPSDCVCLGYTKNGTPVDITSAVASAQRRICLGNIEYHYFAGYSGGGKAIMPGVSTRKAIQQNHCQMVKQEAHAGKLEGNPVREDIEEAAALCGIDFLLNVVLDEHKQIVKAVAGHWVEAHREGCRFLDQLYLKPIKQPADIVLVSQGGAPKDLNLYQTQKALDNAKHAVKKGGVIVLVGSCKEGLGEKTFEQWMTQSESPRSMVERIARDFQLGGHKAAAIAQVLENAEIDLVSEMKPSFVKSIFLKPYDTVQAALDAAFEKLGKNATVIAMPYGGSTLPRVQ